MSYSLYPHQTTGADWLSQGSGILWWEMRTGKTRTALHAYNQMVNRGEVQDLVVATVAMAKTTWQQEIEDVMDLRIPVGIGYGKTAQELQGWPSEGYPSAIPRIYIVNWEILPYWQNRLADLTFRGKRSFALVLDESHLNLRNPENERYAAAFWLSRFATATWEMTGTLQVKSGMDVYHQAKFLGMKHDPFYLLQPDSFGRKYCEPVWNPFKGRKSRDGNRSGGWDHGALIDPDAVMQQLPRVSSLRLRDVADVPLPVHIPHWITDLGQGWDFDRSDKAISEELAALIPIKARLTAEYVNQMAERPVVVFGWNVPFTEQVADLLEAPLIYGGTSVSDRERIRSDFQRGRIPVLVGNFRSLGLGVSLDRANHFVYGQPYWDAALYLQAMARGQSLEKQASLVHHHLLAAGSAEEYVWKRRLNRGREIERLQEATDKRDRVER